jgi:hypothetical protein
MCTCRRYFASGAPVHHQELFCILFQCIWICYKGEKQIEIEINRKNLQLSQRVFTVKTSTHLALDLFVHSPLIFLLSLHFILTHSLLAEVFYALCWEKIKCKISYSNIVPGNTTMEFCCCMHHLIVFIVTFQYHKWIFVCMLEEDVLKAILLNSLYMGLEKVRYSWLYKLKVFTTNYLRWKKLLVWFV